MKRVILTAILAFALAMPAAVHAQTPDIGGDPAKGRAFALEVCTPCHVVARGQLSPLRFANAPPFSAIANTKGVTAMSLAAFLSSPHPTMPNLILAPDERSDVISYILSLQGEH